MMAAEYFNSLGGFSAGLPEVPVIDANGNVVTNVLTNGNVFANVVYATYYKWANGQPFSGSGGNGTPGGSNTQLQYNNNGAFAGIPNVTWDGNILSLGNVSALSISGGTDGYFLQTDGAGNLTWAAGGGGGNGSPGGSNTQVQFNDAGTFGGDVDFTYNKTTNVLNVGNIVAGNVNATHLGSGAGLTNIPGANVTGTVANATYAATAGTATSAISAGSAVTALTSGTVTTSAQPNITSVGTLTSLAVSGNITAANVNGGNLVTANFFSGDGGFLTNITANGSTYSNSNVAAYLPTYTGNIGANWVIADYFSGNGHNLTFLPGANVQGFVANANVANIAITAGTVTTAAQPNITSIGSLTSLSVIGNVNLGSVDNLSITGGTDGYFLQTDGTGNLSWQAAGGNGSPGGNNTQIQYNDGGVFGGSPFLTFNDSTNTVQVAGNLVANTMQLGAGIYKFCTTEVYFATTASTSPDQLLYSIPTEGISGVDFHIIATDPVGATRQSSKISSVVYGNAVQYNEYAGMYINGGIGSFSVTYNPGNILSPPALELKISPDSLNQTVYKMLITVFDD